MARTLPPIISERPLPVGHRPKCLYCGRELQPVFRYIYSDRNTLTATARQFTGYGMDGGSRFHSQRCAIAWAVVAVRMLNEGKIPALLPMLKDGKVRPQ